MPRATSEILPHADEIAAQFEAYVPQPGDRRDRAVTQALRARVLARADAERQLCDAVAAARHEGLSWAAIGAVLGTSGEAAR